MADDMTDSEKRVAQNIMKIGTHHLTIAQLTKQRDTVEAEAKKVLHEIKKLEDETLRLITKK